MLRRISVPTRYMKFTSLCMATTMTAMRPMAYATNSATMVPTLMPVSSSSRLKKACVSRPGRIDIDQIEAHSTTLAA